MNLPELVALEDTVRIGGEEFTFSPLTARDYAEIERRITASRGDPIAVAKRLAADLPADERRAILEKAYDDAMRARHVTAVELDEFMASVDGLVFCFWLSVRKKHPDVTLERAGELLETLGNEALRELMQKASGLPSPNPMPPTQETAA